MPVCLCVSAQVCVGTRLVNVSPTRRRFHPHTRSRATLNFFRLVPARKGSLIKTCHKTASPPPDECHVGWSFLWQTRLGLLRGSRFRFNQSRFIFASIGSSTETCKRRVRFKNDNIAPTLNCALFIFFVPICYAA